ncbi:MAG TPA: hypothetical protein VFW46_11175 [Stellaceae bacterium]|nr:hypothetical protein [Stellaceae bacterium]
MRSRTKKPGAAPGPNLAGSETALIEALWRGDELAAALSAAQSALAARERDLARAQEAIAELSEIVDAVQAALDDLRARAADASEREAQAARKYRDQRDAVAAELFRIARRAEEDAPVTPRKSRLRRWWSRRPYSA